MKVETITRVNRHGLSVPYERVFFEVDDFGEPLNEWHVDMENLAKLILYSDAKELLPIEQEKAAIAEILSVGVEHYLNDVQ